MTEAVRESMDYDVVIVGAGPAGLSAAIRLKQRNPDLQVVVLEKGSEVGAHILSGAVLDPSGLSTLIPDWKERGAPITVPVRRDRFLILGERGVMRIPNFPMPPLLNNHGNYIVSMGNVCRWMAEQAENWASRYSREWPVRNSSSMKPEPYVALSQANSDCSGTGLRVRTTSRAWSCGVGMSFWPKESAAPCPSRSSPGSDWQKTATCRNSGSA